MSTSPDFTYFDLVVTNIKSETTDPQPVYYNEMRTNPIIDDVSLYELSIVRFQLDTQLLPVFIPEIQPSPNTDSNLTIYSVTLSYTPTNTTTPIISQAYLSWSPQNKNTPVPPPPSQTTSGLQSTSGNYYECYNYQWVAYQVYNALQTAFSRLQELVTDAGYDDLNDVQPPIFTWNNDNSTAVLNAESDYYNNAGSSASENPIEIYFNTPLQSLFSSFPFTSYGSSATNGMNYRLNVGNFQGTNEIYLPTVVSSGQTQYLMTQVFQEYSTVSNFSPISSIVFVSNTLPIVPNQLSAPIIYDENNLMTYGNNANFSNIITDLASNDNCYKPNLIYEPTAQYRQIAMQGRGPLSNVDVSVFWKSRLGQLNPVLLPSGGSLSIKFLFTKKKLL